MARKDKAKGIPERESKPVRKHGSRPLKATEIQAGWAESPIHSILEQCTEPILVCDNRGYILEASRGAVQLCGWNPVHSKFSDVFSFTEAGDEGAKIESCITGKGIPSREVTLDIGGRHCDLLLRADTLTESEKTSGGCVVTLTDITERKLAENHTRFLAELAGKLVSITDPDEALSFATQSIGKYLGLERAGLAEIDSARKLVRIRDDFAGTGKSFAGEYKLSDFPNDLHPIFIQGETVAIDDVQTDPRTVRFHEQMYGRFNLRSIISVPRLREGQLVATFSVGSAQPRHWRPEDISLVRSVGDLIWLTLETSRAFKKAREREQRYRLLFQSNPNPMWVIDAATLKFLAVNQAAIKQYGYTRDEFLSLSIEDILEPSQMPRLIECFRQPKHAANHTTTAQEPTDWTHRRQDKSVIEVETTWSMIDYESRPAVLVLINDVTRRKKMEEELRKSEERFRLVAKATNDAIYDWNLLKEQLWWNDGVKVLFGHELANHTSDINWWAEQIHPEDMEHVNETLQEALHNESTAWREQYRFRRADGSFAYVYDRGYIMRDEEGAPVRMIGAMADITDRIKYEMELQRLTDELEHRVEQLIGANKELEAFSYSVSHDLRQPLRAVEGYADMLREDFEPLLGEEGKELLSALIWNCDRMSELINDLLSFSRFSRQSLQRSRLDMTMLARNVWEDTATAEVAEHFEFTVEKMPPAYADRSMMRQVLANLISNAIKFSHNRPNPAIHVGAVCDERGTAYYVRDNGIGFDMRYADKLFGVFKRLHRESEYEGTGVGLAIVHRVLMRHGGEVWAESKPGEGATFYFRLPAYNPEVVTENEVQ